MSLTILAGQADEILWLREAPRLQVGTNAGVRTIGGTDMNQALSPLNVSQRLEINYGVSGCIPAKAGTTNIAVGRFGTELRNIYFNYEVNQIVAPDISRLHEHLLAGRVAKIVYQQAPESVLWVRNEDGTVFGITYDQQERITAFHRHNFGANSSALENLLRQVQLSQQDRDRLLRQASQNPDSRVAINFFTNEGRGNLEFYSNMVRRRLQRIVRGHAALSTTTAPPCPHSEDGQCRSQTEGWRQARSALLRPLQFLPPKATQGLPGSPSGPEGPRGNQAHRHHRG